MKGHKKLPRAFGPRIPSSVAALSSHCVSPRGVDVAPASLRPARVGATIGACEKQASRSRSPCPQSHPDLTFGVVLAIEQGDNVGCATPRRGVGRLRALRGSRPARATNCRRSTPTAGGRSTQEAWQRTLLPAALGTLKQSFSDSDSKLRAGHRCPSRSGHSAASEGLRGFSGFWAIAVKRQFVRVCALDGINRLGSLLPWAHERTHDSIDPVRGASRSQRQGDSEHKEALPAYSAPSTRARRGPRRLAGFWNPWRIFSRAFAPKSMLLRAVSQFERVCALARACHCPATRDLASRKKNGRADRGGAR